MDPRSLQRAVECGDGESPLSLPAAHAQLEGKRRLAVAALHRMPAITVWRSVREGAYVGEIDLREGHNTFDIVTR